MKCFICTNNFKLGCVLTLTFTYFMAELIVGIMINSTSLLADSFHMLSDISSIVIGIVAIHASVLPKSKANTFGWQRAEVFGSLINSVSLLTLCFSILLRSVERFIEPHKIAEPYLLLGVGCGGLLVNFLGIFILNPFGSHGHSHGGMPHNHSNSHNVNQLNFNVTSKDSKDQITQPSNSTVLLLNKQGERLSNTLFLDDESDNEDEIKLYSSMKKNSFPITHEKKHQNMNIKGVLLHVVADFFGSIVVVITALILLYCPDKKINGFDYKLYLDPFLSLIIIMLILFPTIKLFKVAALILLQSVPEEINIRRLNAELVEIPTVANIHDLHVWHLRPGVIIGTVHVKVQSIQEYILTLEEMKNIFHNHNIHCTTIQPEFSRSLISERISSPRDDKCEILCSTLNQNPCDPEKCCPGGEQGIN